MLAKWYCPSIVAFRDSPAQETPAWELCKKRRPFYLDLRRLEQEKTVSRASIPRSSRCGPLRLLME